MKLHTFSLREDREAKVVVHGLNHETGADDIKENLGFTPHPRADVA